MDPRGTKCAARADCSESDGQEDTGTSRCKSTASSTLPGDDYPSGNGNRSTVQKIGTLRGTNFKSGCTKHFVVKFNGRKPRNRMA
eukprot:3546774-Rhodomonas_salina.1